MIRSHMVAYYQSLAMYSRTSSSCFLISFKASWRVVNLYRFMKIRIIHSISRVEVKNSVYCNIEVRDSRHAHAGSGCCYPHALPFLFFEAMFFLLPLSVRDRKLLHCPRQAHTHRKNRRVRASENTRGCVMEGCCGATLGKGGSGRRSTFRRCHIVRLLTGVCLRFGWFGCPANKAGSISEPV